MIGGFSDEVSGGFSDSITAGCRDEMPGRCCNEVSEGGNAAVINAVGFSDEMSGGFSDSKAAGCSDELIEAVGRRPGDRFSLNAEGNKNIR